VQIQHVGDFEFERFVRIHYFAIWSP
jgi:hypothetical protein